MTAPVDAHLLQAFLKYGQIEILDEASKAALRLCSKQIKDYVDATIIACTVERSALDALLNCNWSLTEIEIFSKDEHTAMMPPSFTSLLFELICKFPLLEKLSINEVHELEELPENIGELSHLKEFDIYGVGKLKALPPSFGQLTTLELFELAGCAALSFDGLGPLKHLKQLKHFRILGDIVSEPSFPDWVCSCDFPLLESLDLEYLAAFPSSIDKFKNLTNLDLVLGSSSNIQVPESISDLSSLRHISLLSTCRISLPSSFSKLTTLKQLWITAVTNKEDIAPVQYLTGLTMLKLKCFLIEDESEGYPDFLWNLTLLKTLELWKSDVFSLSAALGNLKNLEELKLQNLDRLEELPESIGTLSCLTSLGIFECQRLRRLPESIGNLAALQFFRMCRCSGLESLPESIGNLAAMKTLNGSQCNGLERLPESLGKLKNLKTLSIWGSKFSQLPNSIGSLESLEQLSVRGCSNFLELPDSLGNLNALRVLEIYDSLKLHIPDSFADLILGKPYEEWSLKRVWFAQCEQMVLSQKVMLALALLQQHGVWPIS